MNFFGGVLAIQPRLKTLIRYDMCCLIERNAFCMYEKDVSRFSLAKWISIPNWVFPCVNYLRLMYEIKKYILIKSTLRIALKNQATLDLMSKYFLCDNHMVASK